MGQKIAAVSAPTNHTQTRMGILTLETAQIIFVDTRMPPRHKLGENEPGGGENAGKSDLILFLVETSQPPKRDHMLADCINHIRQP
jgi:GTPase Era involved in 16S rRNA processing